MKLRNPFKKRSDSHYTITFAAGDVTSAGYTRLLDCPEISAGIRWLADLVSSMTLQLLENDTSGDVRVRDNLARTLDVEPWRLGTRQTLVAWLVKTLVSTGNAYLMPRYQDGMLEELIPLPGAFPQSVDGGLRYEVAWRGSIFQPDSLLCFTLDPDERRPWLGTGCNVTLLTVADSLKQASETKTAYMTSDYKPPLIVSVNAYADGLDNADDRDKILDAYVTSSKAGRPWVIPGDLIKVESVRPLSLNDLAIKDGIELDRRTVASVLGIPAYVLGVGSYNKDEYNNAIRTRVRTICQCIEQTLTLGLLYSPKRYLRFNARSLYAYDLTELAQLFEGLYVRGLATGNEVRDAVGLSPKADLDELVMLENYIPAGMIGDQKKLIQEGQNDEE